MEPHPPHVHHSSGKKFSHYFYEFLMLFLAVFCGFLAENFREHKVEIKREREYIISLVEDLSVDTMNLSQIIKEFEKSDLRLDTLLNMYPKLTLGFNDTLLRNLSVVQGFPDFIYTDRTMQQLKNSGGMQLIKNKSAANGIMDYDSMVRDLSIDVTSLDEIFNQLRLIWYELMDEQGLISDVTSKPIAQLNKEHKGFLLINNKSILGKFNNMIRDFRGISNMVKTQESKLKEKGIYLIALLKKEYQIE